MPYYPRIIEKIVLQHLKNFPVVGITGPRQSGKSTMLRKLLGRKYRYISFDDLNMVDQFHTDPKRFMDNYSEHLIFDEVQRVPEIFSAIKLLVDNDRKKYGKFVVTGSSQFAFMKKVSESLAGRIGLITLLPFQFSEVPARLRQNSQYQGGYPELIDRKYEGAFEWYTSYLDTYLTRDIRDLREIGDIRDFRRFVQLLASRTAQILNMSDISRDIGVSVMTVKKWISVLEASYIIMLLQPFYKNLGKRIVKSPKLYFLDTGLVSYLTGIRTKELYEQGPLHGALFENYIVTEIYKKILHTRSGADLYYFRDSNGNEIDLIIDNKISQEYIEIKSGHTFRPEMIRPMTVLKPAKSKGYLLYHGLNQDFSSDITVLNYQAFLKNGIILN